MKKLPLSEVEFFKNTDIKMGAVIELYDPEEMQLARLDYHDFKRMREAGLNPESEIDMARYCNEYKSTEIRI